MKQIIRLTESDLHRLVKGSVNRILREGFYDPDDELRDELSAAGASGKATEKQIFDWEEDLWINVNKAFQNANYLFNKTRNERYAKIAEEIGNTLEFFPDDAENRYMVIDYDPEAGYGG